MSSLNVFHWSKVRPENKLINVPIYKNCRYNTELQVVKLKGPRASGVYKCEISVERTFLTRHISHNVSFSSGKNISNKIYLSFFSILVIHYLSNTQINVIYNKFCDLSHFRSQLSCLQPRPRRLLGEELTTSLGWEISFITWYGKHKIWRNNLKDPWMR